MCCFRDAIPGRIRGIGWSLLGSWCVSSHTTITEVDQPFLWPLSQGLFGESSVTAQTDLGIFQAERPKRGEDVTPEMARNILAFSNYGLPAPFAPPLSSRSASGRQLHLVPISGALT